MGVVNGSSSPALSRRLSLPSCCSQTQPVLEEILAEARRLCYSTEDLFAIRLCLDEALTNAVKHGNGRDPSKRVHVEYELDAVRVWVRIRDEGPGFDLAAIPDPRLPENLLRPSGRGVMLIRHYMSDVAFHPPGNCVEMTRHRTADNEKIGA